MSLQADGPPDSEIACYLESSARHYSLPTLSCSVQTMGRPTGFFASPGTVDRNAVYKVGSLTKLVTAIALLLLEQRRALRLSDPVSAHLPWFAHCFRPQHLPGPAIRDLLLHTAGLPRGDLLTANPSAAEIQSAVEALAPLGFAAEVDRRVKYSNLGYILLGQIVAAAGGAPYADFVRREVLDPLGMTRSGFCIPDSDLGITTPHHLTCFSKASRSPYETRPATLYAAPHASMDLYSTASDYSKLLGQLVAGPAEGRERLFKPDLVRTLFSTLQPMDRQLHAGAGFYLLKSRHGDIVFENAEHFGHSAAMLLMPASGLAIAAFANRGSAAPDLAFVVGSLKRRLEGGGSAELLGHDYPQAKSLTGTYGSACGAELRLSLRGTRLYGAIDGEPPVPLIYKGQHCFMKPEGARSKYILRVEYEQRAVGGLSFGPMYFVRGALKCPKPAGDEHSGVIGLYQNDAAGRLAVFTRNDALWLAFSPCKEARLDRISVTDYVQRTGPFIGETVRLDGASRTLQAGGRIFDHSGEYY